MLLLLLYALLYLIVTLIKINNLHHGCYEYESIKISFTLFTKLNLVSYCGFFQSLGFSVTVFALLCLVGYHKV